MTFGEKFNFCNVTSFCSSPQPKHHQAIIVALVLLVVNKQAHLSERPELIKVTSKTYALVRMRWLLLFPLATCLGFQRPVMTFIRTSRSAMSEMDELPSMLPLSHYLDTPQVGELRDNVNMTTSTEDSPPLAGALTFDKFLTMQVRCRLSCCPDHVIAITHSFLG